MTAYENKNVNPNAEAVTDEQDYDAAIMAMMYDRAIAGMGVVCCDVRRMLAAERMEAAF